MKEAFGYKLPLGRIHNNIHVPEVKILLTYG